MDGEIFKALIFSLQTYVSAEKVLIGDFLIKGYFFERASFDNQA